MNTPLLAVVIIGLLLVIMVEEGPSSGTRQ